MVGDTHPAQWLPDPTGRHAHRFWNGERWTENVADNGVTAVDALEGQPAPPVLQPVPATTTTARSTSGFFARMRAASEARKARQAQQQYEATLSTWSAEDAELSQLVERARGYDGTTDIQTPLVLKRNERVFYVLSNAGLMETRSGPRHWQGGYSGFSFKVTNRIRYHVGGTRGTSVQGPDETKLLDTGTATITNQRVVFQGSKQSREWAFSKLLGYQHDEHSPWTPIQVSNRQKVSGIRYDANTAEAFQFNLALALAMFNDTRDAFAAGLTKELEDHRALKPVAPPAAALIAAGAVMTTETSPTDPGSGALGAYRRAPRWAQIAIPAILVLLLIGAIGAISGGGSSDASNNASSNHAAPIVTAATNPPTTLATTTTTTTTTTVPPTTVPPTTVPPTTAPPATEPPTPATEAAPQPAAGPVCSPLSPAGNCYRRGEFCPGTLHNQTIQGSDGAITCNYVNGYWRFE